MAFNKMPIISKPNVDASGNPQLIQVSNEPHQIFKSKIVLNGIPDKFSRVSITDEDEVIYVEKFDTDILTGHQFKVNYSSGVITFPTELEGWSVTVNYYSKGVELVGSERIYTKLDDNGDVSELLSDKIDEIKLLRQNYDNAVHMDIVRKVRLEYTATQNVTSFVLDANNYNPLIDMVFLYYKGAVLIQNKQYVITGTTVTLVDWTLLTGETIDIVIERGINEILPAGTNGGDLMLGTVGENKLSADVQLKLNKTLVIQDYTFTATQDHTTTFTVASDIFNAETDTLDIYRNNLKLTKDVKYSVSGQIVTLATELNTGDYIEYRITKNTGNSVPLMPDGSLIQNKTIAKKKLTQELQNEITKATTNEIEIIAAREGKATLKDKIDEIISRASDISISVKDFGAKCDGVTDDTLSLTNAISYAVANRRQVVIIPDKIRLTSTITIPKNITLTGVGNITSMAWIPQSTGENIAYGRPSSTMTGSWVFCDVPLNSHMFIMEDSSKIQNLGFWYPANDTKDWTSLGTHPYNSAWPVFQPLQFVSTIYVDSGKQTYMENLFFINSYHAIELNNSEHYKIKNIKISPLKYGITVQENGASGEISEIMIYPFWSKPYEANYLDMMRPIFFSGTQGVGIWIGSSSLKTVEQVIMSDINIFCVADGMRLDGKGVQLSNFKIDNTYRPLTITNNNTSMLHNISNGWVASYWNYGDTTPVTDGSLYAIKVMNGGNTNISNINITCAQGYGLWIPTASYKTSVSNIYIGSCCYRGVVLGSDVGSYRISLDHCTIQMVRSDGVACTFKNLYECFVDDLRIMGDCTKYLFSNAYSRELETNTTTNEFKFLEKENVTFYVDSTKPDGFGTSSASPFATLPEAISMIPKHIKGKITIVIGGASGQTGTFEQVSGSGELIVIGRDGGANQTCALTFSNVNAKLTLKDFTILTPNVSYGKALTIDKCPNVSIENVAIAGDTSNAGNGMYITNSKLKINNCYVAGYYYGMFVDEFSGVKTTNWKPNASIAVGTAISGASVVVKGDSTMITGNTSYVEVSGGKLYS